MTLASLGKPQFIMNVYLHVIILFIILSLLFKLVITKLSTTGFSSVINNLMKTSLGDNAKTLLKNKELKNIINNILHNLIESKLNNYMIELTTIQNNSSSIEKNTKATEDALTQIKNINNNLIKTLNIFNNNTTNTESSINQQNMLDYQLTTTIQLLQNTQYIVKDNRNITTEKLLNGFKQIDYTQLYKVHEQLNVYYKKPDEVAKTINVAIYDKIMVYIVFLVVFYIILAFIFSKDKDFHISHILIENGITFTFVGIVEIIFFLKIAFKFIPVVPSYMNTTLFSIFKEKLTS